MDGANGDAQDPEFRLVFYSPSSLSGQVQPAQSSCRYTKLLQAIIHTGHTQKNGAVLIVFTIKTAPFFCVCPVYNLIILTKSGGDKLLS
jgi:hypothetical protein